MPDEWEFSCFGSLDRDGSGDADGDGVLDLLVGEKTSAGVGKVAAYSNSGTNAVPIYDVKSYVQFFNATTNQLEDVEVDASGCQGASARMVDFDGDGALDLFVGRSDGRILYYPGETTGDGWRLTEPDYVEYGVEGLKSEVNVGARALFEVCDWNGDGLNDLLVGSLDGKFYLLVNDATTGAYNFASTTTLTDASGAELTVESGRSAPTLADVNGDGLADLISGATNGNLYVYLNVGTSTSPKFVAGAELSDGEGAISLGGATRSRPYAYDLDADGLPDLIVGGSDGLVRRWRGVKTSEFNAMGEPGTPFVVTQNATISNMPETTTLSAPTVTIAASTVDSITIEWSTVENATGYEALYALSGETEYAIVSLEAGVSSYTFSDLPSSTSYDFKVRALGDEVAYTSSVFSSIVTASTEAVQQLSAPTITPVGTTVDSITVEWTPVEHATKYYLAYAPSGEKTFTTVSVKSGVTNYTLTGLSSSTAYDFKVRAIGDKVAYTNSNFSVIRTASTLKELPHLETPTITSFSSTEDSITVEWTPVENATKYYLAYAPSGEKTFTTVSIKSSSTSYTLAGLTVSTLYDFKVRAIADKISYANSEFSEVRTALVGEIQQLPTPAITSFSSSVDSIIVKWTPVENAVKYYLAYAPSGEKTFTTVSIKSSSTSYTLAGLPSLTAYDFKVRAIGDKVAYSNSEFSEVRTASTVVDLPQLSTPEFTAFSSTEDAITVEWTPVENASKYYLAYAPSGEKTFTTVSIKSPSTSYTLAGLSSSTAYDFKVRAIADKVFYANSPFSEVETAITIDAPELEGYAAARFYDAEKSSGATSNLCWASGAANVLYYAGWATAVASVDLGGKSVAFGSEDDVFEYVAGSFSNKGSSALYAMEWFITGEYEGAGLTGWAQPSEGSGGFYASQGYDFDELSRLYSFAKESNPERILPSATELLRESWGVCASLGFYSNGPNSTLASAHTITVWGYEVDANYSADDPRYYKALLVTDSDDGGARGRYAANELKTYAIQWNDAYERYSLVGYESSRTPWLEEIVCLAPRSIASNHVAATYAGYTAPTTSHALALSPSTIS